MRLKPRSTTLNPKALLFREFIPMESSNNLNAVYLTYSQIGDTRVSQKWLFNRSTLKFDKLGDEFSSRNVINVGDNIVSYLNNYYQFVNGEWITPTSINENTLLSARYSNIANYQTNKYYYAGTFDYVMKGGQEGSTTQPIKGTIIPLDSLNISYYKDDLCMKRGDMVVLDGHLFKVEDTECVRKRMPKPFNIYFATLNNIL